MSGRAAERRDADIVEVTDVDFNLQPVYNSCWLCLLDISLVQLSQLLNAVYPQC